MVPAIYTDRFASDLDLCCSIQHKNNPHADYVCKTKEQADTFEDVHQRLIDAGLME